MSDLILFFDTETTGFPDFKKPSTDPCQPHIVDICGLLYTPDGDLVDKYEALVMPNGWEISPEVSAIHGITHDYAVINGIDEREAVGRFGLMHKRASLRVAHNVSFDDRILRIGIKRFFSDAAAERYKTTPSFCTAMTAKPIMKMPPTAKMMKSNFRNSFKTPNLAEALEYFTGKILTNAHRALPDTQACADIYFAIKKLEAEQK